MQPAAPVPTVDNTTLVERSFARVRGDAGALVARFYTALFTRHPSLRPMFPTDLREQEKKLAAALGMVVGNIRKPGVLMPALKQLGEKHVGYGARPEHFDAVGAALVTALSATDPGWDAPTQTAWVEAYGAIVAGMMEGMRGK